MHLIGFVLLIYVFCYLPELGNCTQAEETVNTDEKELKTRRVEGHVIVQLAKKLNSPLLKLLAASMMSQDDKLNSVKNETELVRTEITNLSTNTDTIIKAVQTKIDTIEFNLTNILQDVCQTKSCLEWTDWTACEAVTASVFGTQNRTRKCGFRNKNCEGIVSVNTSEQIEMQLCEKVQPQHRCPSEYVITPHGYCVKKNIGSYDQWENASVLCSKEGGHLSHVDSNSKWQDIKELLVNHTSKVLWIDGMKKDSEAEWLFKNGTSKTTFTYWAASHPNKTNFPVCVFLQYSDGQWYWKDWNCHSTSGYICEIIK